MPPQAPVGPLQTLLLHMTFPTPRTLAVLLAALLFSGLAPSCGPTLLGVAIGSGGDSDGAPGPVLPSAPSPANGLVDVDPNLADLSTPGRFTWTPSIEATAQRLRLATSVEGLVDSPIADAELGAAVAEFEPPALQAETAYFWRVDSTIAGVDTLGPTWEFTTSSISTSEVEPNDSFDEASNLLLGQSISASVAGSAEQDWFRVNLAAGRTYEARLACYGVDQATWESADSAPEFTLFDTDGATALLRHRALAEFSSLDAAFYDFSPDLDFPRFAVPASGIYFFRVRGVSASSPAVTPQAGGAYLLRVADVGAVTQDELEIQETNALGGQSNTDITNAETLNLIPDATNPLILRGRVSGFLGLELDAGSGGVRPDFDWYQYLLPVVGDLYEVSVEINAANNGLYLPDGPGGIGDLSLNIFWSRSFGVTSFQTNDRGSIGPKDPALSELVLPSMSFQRNISIGVVHDEDIFADPFNFNELPTNYSELGVPYILDIEVVRHPVGSGFVTEAEMVGGSTNDTAAGAEALSFGEIFLGNLRGGDADETDWLSFEVESGQLAQVQIWNQRNALGLVGDGTSEPVLELFEISDPDSPQTVNAANNTNGAFDPVNVNARLFASAIVLTSGTYGIRVEDTNAVSNGDGHQYAVAVDALFTTAPESEGNDAIGSANEFSADETVSGVLDGGSPDSDFYRFSATAGEFITFACYSGTASRNVYEPERDGFGSTAVPRLTVRDGAGVALASVTNSGVSSGETLTNPLATLELRFVADEDAEFFLEVSDGEESFAPERTYVVELTRE